jgi:trehalose/maltose hydrolase-like predicted phosphorylase
MLSGIADFWASRVEFDTDIEQYVINGVIPPDEYAVNVNNSVYTNVVASYSLSYATVRKHFIFI